MYLKRHTDPVRRTERLRGTRESEHNQTTNKQSDCRRDEGQRLGTPGPGFASVDQGVSGCQAFAQWLVDTIPGGGGGSEAKKKFVYLKSTSKFGPL